MYAAFGPSPQTMGVSGLQKQRAMIWRAKDLVLAASSLHSASTSTYYAWLHSCWSCVMILWLHSRKYHCFFVKLKPILTLVTLGRWRFWGFSHRCRHQAWSASLWHLSGMCQKICTENWWNTRISCDCLTRFSDPQLERGRTFHTTRYDSLRHSLRNLIHDQFVYTLYEICHKN